jgi:hypothetical protein
LVFGHGWRFDLSVIYQSDGKVVRAECTRLPTKYSYCDFVHENPLRARLLDVYIAVPLGLLSGLCVLFLPTSFEIRRVRRVNVCT